MQDFWRLSLFCQLPGEHSVKRNYEFHRSFRHDIIKIREMVLVSCERTWTFGLCSLYFLCNAVILKTFAADKKKDLVYVSDGKIFKKNYRFEDFFWTGSEDDSVRENSVRNQTDLEINLVETNPLDAWRTTTVFHTTTILFATVYPDSESCRGTEQGCTPKISPVQTRSVEFFSPTLIPEFSEILPCPTQKVSPTNSLEFPNTFSNDNGVERSVTNSGASSTSSTSSTITEFKTNANDATPRGIEPDEHNVINSTVFPIASVDQQYWIKTILRSDNFSRNLELNIIENSLSILYKKALRRRQEKYFGGNDFYNRKDRRISQQVKVNILNATRSGQAIELVYFVSVADKPVPAESAANDMRLITAGEVIAELGYPILSKAEPYIKSTVPLGARVKGRTRDTWLFIGSVIAAVLLLIILAALFALELSKKRSKQNLSRELEKRKHFLKEEKGTNNLAFEGETDLNAKGSPEPACGTGSKTGSQPVEVTVKFNPEERRGSTSSSGSSSEASLVRLRYQKRREVRLKEAEGKPKPKPRTRIRKVENSDYTTNYERTNLDRAGSAISRNTYNQVMVEGYDDSLCLTRSPTSYLSMPSVKAFPRGTQIPEPLNKILEPISIRHLDADSDSPNEYQSCSQIRHKVDVEHICEVKNNYPKRKAVTRHASLEGDDPGFIGPVVWNRHCEKIGKTGRINMEETDEIVSVGRMRRRFNELLDDALSMFGSRNPSPETTEERSAKQVENRVYSAVVRPAGVKINNTAGGRPKTTGSRRPQSAVILGPRGAWETPICSTLLRSDTATVFQKLSPSPKIDKNLIYVNSDLVPGDPAVPLIAAIKNELKKFEEPPNENI